MAWSMLVFAFLFKISESSVQVPMVSIFAVIFVIFYAPTAGTSPFVSGRFTRFVNGVNSHR